MRIVSADKWGEDFTAETPVGVVFRQSWERRSAPVLQLARELLATDTGSPAPKQVHQLRVATRRLHAVLELFDDQLPRKLRDPLESHLHKLRSLCGPVRNLDVFAEFFEEGASSPETEISPATWEKLREQLTAEREQRLKRLKKKLGKLLPEIEPLFQKADAECAKRGAKPKETPPIGDAMLARLPEITRTFWKDLKRAARDADDLHPLRILGKEFRYMLELFAPLFPETFRDELYPHLEGLQEQLGKLQDCRSARGIIRRLKKRPMPVVQNESPETGEVPELTECVANAWKQVQKNNRDRQKSIRKEIRELIHQEVEEKLGKRFQNLFRQVSKPPEEQPLETASTEENSSESPSCETP